MDTFTALCIILFSGLTHATFQLSVSVLTLLSGHSFGKAKSHKQLLSLSSSFLLGSFIVTLLLVSTFTLLALDLFGEVAEPVIWSISSGLVIGVGLSVWLFYYRRKTGTELWIPRPIAAYLHERSKRTSNSAESFALGVIGGLGEIIFTLAPLLIAGLAIMGLDSHWKLVGLAIYVTTSMLPLVIVWMLIGGGHKVSELQRWRENNKHFLQFVAGSGLIVLGLYVYINQVVTSIGGV